MTADVYRYYLHTVQSEQRSTNLPRVIVHLSATYSVWHQGSVYLCNLLSALLNDHILALFIILKETQSQSVK